MKLTLEEVETHLKTLVDKGESIVEADAAAARAAGLALLGHGLHALHVIAEKLEIIASPPAAHWPPGDERI